MQPVATWVQRLRASPELFPLALDPSTDRVDLVALQPVDYEKASFLDGRLALPPAAQPAYSELAEAAAGLAPACDFIFHVGHVGSTLLSRLLGQHGRVFSVREPQVLRTLAQAEAAGGPWRGAQLEARTATFLGLFSRTWSPAKRALIKATSLVGEMAEPMLALEPAARAILMTAAPETYIATILGGPNSRLELRAAAAGRLQRLARRVGGAPWTFAAMSEGELAAMSWACEMAALAPAQARWPERTLWLDFDVFLAAPDEGLARALGALHGRADPAEVAALAGSAYFQRYSKAPEYGYGPDVRRAVLDQARRDEGPEIRRGLAWLESAARHPPIARAVEAAEAARGA